ncbi:NAD(P)-binding domain-containing protein [Streptomyces sp. NPDC005968]|uniref:NADPH-dependent F420 reductase n=1 Tax=Streptomyces sp. NPDC005968 TaxID=3154574 RepID=UPI0033E1F996
MAFGRDGRCTYRQIPRDLGDCEFGNRTYRVWVTVGARRLDSRTQYGRPPHRRLARRAANRHSERHVRMRIGIIGAGNIGATLTRRLSALGHEVRVANSRDPQTLADLAGETGATAVWAADAADDADLVIVTITLTHVRDLAPGIVDDRRPGAPVIDTNNYYPQYKDGFIAAIEAGTPESVWVSEQLGVPVYKAFNGIGANFLQDAGAPAGAPERIAIPVAGADGPGKELVFDLVDQLGFDPIDAGPLEESWRQQPDTPFYAKNYPADRARHALAEATPERPAQFRARQPLNPGRTGAPAGATGSGRPRAPRPRH